MKAKGILFSVGAVIITAFAAYVGTRYYYSNIHKDEMAQLEKKCNAAIKAAEEDDERRKEVEAALDEIAKQNKDLEDEIEIITNNRDSWKNKCIKIANNTVTNIRESISETHRVIEATEIEHKIQEIEELSVIEYKYKQTCVIDEKDTFNFFLLDGTENPFTNKKLVVSMVGKIKAGIEADKVTVETDSASKKIIIGLPASKILSNELDEDSFYVYLEEDTIFNRLKAQDHSALRQKINDESRQFAIDNGVLEQADERVHQLIRTMLEQIPDVKDYYTIEFKTV